MRLFLLFGFSRSIANDSLRDVYVWISASWWYMQDWITRLDDFLRMVGNEVLQTGQID